MNLIEEILKHKDAFNNNQKNFLIATEDVFKKVNHNILGPFSSVVCREEQIIIRLEHALKPITQIEVRVYQFEIYIIIGGIGKSMFYYFQKVLAKSCYMM